MLDTATKTTNTWAKYIKILNTAASVNYQLYKYYTIDILKKN